jgi:hypothetical protein
MASAHKQAQAQLEVRPVHPFPARMAARIALDELRGKRGSLRVLDPMAGSGTTLAVARKLGHSSVGFDSDPLAVLIARAWCADVDEHLLSRTAAFVHQKAESRWRRTGLLDAYPEGADDETCSFVRYWFDGINRKQLSALANAISGVRNASIRDLLWCAFSRLIIAKQAGTSLALDLTHSRPHRAFAIAPIRAIDSFPSAVRFVINGAPFKSESGEHPKADIRIGDARQLPLPAHSVDVVITSPPYLNAIDYMRAHKFSLVWMGYRISELRGLRAAGIGTEVSAGGNPDDGAIAGVLESMGAVHRLSGRYPRMLARYVADMGTVLHEIVRVLSPGGRAILVVGDSTIRGVYVRNSRAVACLADQHGLALESMHRRPIPDNRRYLPPPSSPLGKGLQHRMRTEVVLSFQKP